MNFIELYDRIDARIKKLMNKGKDEKEARTLAPCKSEKFLNNKYFFAY